jgi:intraflagellar transport protein 140
MIRSIRVNCTGSKLSIIASRIDETSGLPVPDEKLWFYDVELDRVFHHDFGPNYFPHGHHWDNTEPKLVAVETHKIERPRVEKKEEAPKVEEKKTEEKKLHSTTSRDVPPSRAEKAEREAKEKRDREEKEMKDDKKMEGYEDEGEVKTEAVPRMADSEVTTLFATSEGILMQDSFAIEVQGESMMGLEVPFIFFMSRPTDDPNFAGDTVPRVKKRSLRDFVGLEKVPLETQKDLMNFSYHLTVGNMDEAYRAVKKISSETIWENMAQMCVKTKRLDVAEVCLGNMNNARGARAVREAKKLEKDAQVAMLAIQLGLPEDAERLYKSCGRYDLLTKFYMACGRWKDALKVCAKFDRIHLKTTHYLYAKHLESTGDTAAAIKNYEKSETHKHEVPRMLFDAQHIADLEVRITLIILI